MDTKKHGGKRDGAGRKSKFSEPTATMRLPVSVIPRIKAMFAGNVVELRPSHMDVSNILQVAPNLSLQPRPLFSAAVPAGFPSPADDYVEGQLDLNEHFIAHPSATFFVRVTGESMRGAGIFEGDILIVDRALTAVHGSIVIAVVDNELTVKRLYKQQGRVELHPENPAFPPIKLQDGMELTIWGVVCGVTRKL
jgi:DNA polymerase V